MDKVNPMKFLHTADWQIGARISHAGDRAPAIRAKRFEAAKEVVQVAKEEEVDFVLIAGDLFENHNVSDTIVHRTVRILGDLGPIPVYILPGNHDPLRPGGVWDRDSWSTCGDHIHLLEGPASVEPVNAVELIPCPLTQKRSTVDPTAEIPSRVDGDDRIRIAVAHGALSDVADTPNFPIDPDRPDRADLDYLALGDWHGTTLRDRLAYPGTIEQSAFDESDPGNVLVVEIGASGEEPEVEKRRVGQLRWMEVKRRLGDVTDLEALESKLADSGKADQLVLRMDLILEADADPELRPRLGQLRERLESEAFHLDWRLDESAFLTSTDVELPVGLIQEADRVMVGLLDGDLPEQGPGRELATRDPADIREARLLLRRLAREEQG